MKCMFRIGNGCWTLLAGLMLLSGCKAMSPPVAFYTLSAMSGPPSSRITSGAKPGIAIGVGPLTIPRILDRPQVVTRVSANRIQVAEFNRWAGAIGEEVLRVLADNLSLLLDTQRVAAYPWERHFVPDYQIFLDIHQFDGTMGQKAVLRVTWTVTAGETAKPLVTHRSLIEEKMSGADYETMVAAKSRAVYALSLEIAEAIGDLHGGG